MTHHPFVVEMGDDTLSLERGRRYFLQDYVFVNDLVTMMSMGLAKAPDLVAASHLHSFLAGILDPQAAAENEFFLRAFDVLQATEEEYSAVSASPITQGFGDFLVRTGTDGQFRGDSYRLLCHRGDIPGLGYTAHRTGEAAVQSYLPAVDRSARTGRAGPLRRLVQRIPRQHGPLHPASCD